MDAVSLAIISGILALLFGIAAVFIFRVMYRKENISFLIPLIIILISEAALVFLFAVCVFSLLL